MRIISVVDILDGKVVHGVQGKREIYKPVESLLTNGYYPLEVVKAFTEKLGLKDLYIADLNSIEKKGNNFDIIKDIKKRLEIRVILDPGIRDSEDLNREIVENVDSVILGTETLVSLQTVEDAISVKWANGVIVSIDMKGEDMLSNIKDFKGPEETIRKLHKLGVNNFILLDLKKVGSMGGPSQQLEQLISNIRDLELYLIAGGGIKSVHDIVSLQNLGVDAVLIATAFHTGKITKKELEFLSHQKYKIEEEG